MTPSGIEPATFWLVVQCLNQLRYCLPPPLQRSYYTINKYHVAREDNSYWLTKIEEKNFLQRKVHKDNVTTQSSVNIAGLM